MRFGPWIFLGIGLLARLAVAAQVSTPPIPSPQPTLRAQDSAIALRVRTRGTWEPLVVSTFGARVDIQANHAITTLDLVIENPNPLRLEGELDLPVAPDQTVAGFALDMDGKLREASVVERQKAESAYTSIVRRNVDPGILDQNGLNRYRLRIFPLPPKGRRQVQIRLRQALQATPEGFRLRLPMAIHGEVGPCRLQILDAGGRSESPELLAVPMGGMPLDTAFLRERGAWVLRAEALHGRLEGHLELKLKQPLDQPSQVVATDDGSTFAYAHVRLPILDEAKPQPKKVILAWDASRTGCHRDHARIWAVLSDYLSVLPDTAVEVWAFNVGVFQRKTFTNISGQLDGLKAFLDGLPSDGTCNLEALDFTQSGAEEVLLCTPGITHAFHGMPPTSPIPVQVLMASSQAQWLRMRAYARASGGEALDLMALSRSEARRILRRTPFQFLGLDVLEGKVSSVTPSNPRPVRGGMGLACILESEAARIRVGFGRAGRVELTRDVQLKRGTEAGSTPRQLWAETLLEELEEDSPKDRSRLLRIALNHRLVTRDTALLVLESLEDYLHYDVVPPAELEAAWKARQPKPSAIPPSTMSTSTKPAPEPSLPDFEDALMHWQRARRSWWSQATTPGASTGEKPAPDRGFWGSLEGRSVSSEDAPPAPPLPMGSAGSESMDETWCKGLALSPSLGFPGGSSDGDEDMGFAPGERRSARLQALGSVSSDGCVSFGSDVVGSGMSVPGGSVGRIVDSDLDPVSATCLGAKPTRPLEIPGDDSALPTKWPASEWADQERFEGVPRHWRPMGVRAQALSQALSRAMAQARPTERLDMYLGYRGEFCDSPTFFMDCARIFAKAGNRDLARGILSNLGEPRRRASGEDRESSVDGVRWRCWAEALWELGDLESAARVLKLLQDQETHNLETHDRALLLRRATLEEACHRYQDASDLLERAILGFRGQQDFDPLQGFAWERRQALLAEHPNLKTGNEEKGNGQSGEPGERMPVWALRVEVEGILEFLRSGSISIVDPRGERVWFEMPLGTCGLGLDDAVDGGPYVFMSGKAMPGTYRVEFNSRGLRLDEHIPQEYRVRVTQGFGARHPRVMEFRNVLRAPSDKLLATFTVAP